MLLRPCIAPGSHCRPKPSCRVHHLSAFPSYAPDGSFASPISPWALAGTAALLLAACYLDRPRGWAARELVEVCPLALRLQQWPQSELTHTLRAQVRQSQIANRGVFARRRLAPGTLLGVYPGRVRSESSMLDKAAVVPCCKTYVFRQASCPCSSHRNERSSGWVCASRTNGGRFMDPTDATGLVSDRPGPGMPWPAVDNRLAFVNEPPPGRLTNVTIEDGREDNEICFVAACEIEAGEELFIDYGRTYDRSTYARPPDRPAAAQGEEW